MVDRFGFVASYALKMIFVACAKSFEPFFFVVAAASLGGPSLFKGKYRRRQQQQQPRQQPQKQTNNTNINKPTTSTSNNANNNNTVLFQEKSACIHHVIRSAGQASYQGSEEQERRAEVHWKLWTSRFFILRVSIGRAHSQLKKSSLTELVFLFLIWWPVLYLVSVYSHDSVQTYTRTLK